MTYNAGIPNATDLISNSQQQIKDNFTQLNTQFGIDHVAFNTGSGNGSGFHKQITFNDNNAPGAVPVDPFSIIFTKNNAAGHPSPYFLNSQAASVAAAIPLIPDLVTSGTNFGFRLGGLIINFGRRTGSGTVTFAIDMTNAQYSLVLGGTSDTVFYSSFAHDTANLVVTGGSNIINYLAIGA